MKKFEHISDIFFDLDHTIYDFDKNAALSFNHVFKDLNLEVSSDFMQKFKPISDFYWDKLAKKEITNDFMKFNRLNDTFNAMNMKVSENLIYQIADRFLEKLTDYNYVFNGAYESLDYLKSKYRLHIITNGPDKVQELKLLNSDLKKYFYTITNSEMAGVKKPDPLIFELALKTANVNASNSLMIGDNLDADIFGALNVGMDVIWFDEFKSEHNNKFTVINELVELKNLL